MCRRTGVGKGDARSPEHNGAVQNRAGIVAAGADHAGMTACVERTAGIADGLYSYKGLRPLSSGQRHDILTGAHGITGGQTAVHGDDFGIIVAAKAQLKDEFQAVMPECAMLIIK